MEDEVNVSGYIIDNEGRGFVWPGSLEELTLEPNETDISYSLTPLFEDFTFTATVKWPKYFRCKNRKRFRKLLMSLGMPRNYVNWLIWYERLDDSYPSYQEMWNEIRTMYMDVMNGG